MKTDKAVPIPKSLIQSPAANPPVYQHPVPGAVYLGKCDAQDGAVDLYWQGRRVAARFGPDPSDYLMSGSSLANRTIALTKALERAAKAGLPVEEGLSQVNHLTTRELIDFLAHAKGKEFAVELTHQGVCAYQVCLRNGKIVGTGTRKEFSVTPDGLFVVAPQTLGACWRVDFGGRDVDLLRDLGLKGESDERDDAD